MDYARDAFKGDAVLSGIKIAGSAAWSGAVTVGATPFLGPTQALAGGIYMGAMYDTLFDQARQLGSQLGIKIYALTHPDGTTINTQFSQPTIAVNTLPPTDAAARNSTNLVTVNDTTGTSFTVKSGGAVWDGYALQKNKTSGFTDWNEYQAAIRESNPDIADINQVKIGQVVYQPQKLSDGSITYNYAGGASINSNAITGEYDMVVPNADGGQTVYSRTVDAEAGYTVREVSTNKFGNTTYDFTGSQVTAASEGNKKVEIYFDPATAAELERK